MSILHDKSRGGEPAANSTELVDVSPAMRHVVIGSRTITDQAISEATGTTKAQRRAAVDSAVKVFVARHYRLMPVESGVT